MSATPTPVWNKFHSPGPSQTRAARKQHLPARPATSPDPPSPPDKTNEPNVTHDTRPKLNRSDSRWSEVVPPATALTFAAVWDPEDGLVTFGGASLSTSEQGTERASPDDADGRSQVLTVDFLNLGTTPNTAMESTIFPYAQSRFAMSELSTHRFPASPTRRSSAGTGLALDANTCPELQMQVTEPESRALEKNAPARIEHQRSSSEGCVSPSQIGTFGFGLCKAFRREATEKHPHSKAERYGFLRRAAANPNMAYTDFNEHEKPQMRLDDSGTPPKSAGLRSMFARSIWLRGGIGTLRDAGVGFSCRPRIVDDHDPDSVTLDSGFDHLEVDEDMDESWIRRYGGSGEEGTELDTALRRNVDKLKSTFSWTTTSTSRYVDVAAFLDTDSDSDSTISSLGVPVDSRDSPQHAKFQNSTTVHVLPNDCDSGWFQVEPPTPRPALVVSTTPRPTTHRKLVKKPSKQQITCPGAVKARSHSQPGPTQENPHRYHICAQCHLRIEVGDLEATDRVAYSKKKKGKGRANSQPELPEVVRNSVSIGRPAAIRSSSSPAYLPFPQARSRSLPGSRAATPAEVLSRDSYNHEWASPIPSRPISHARSPSAPQQRSSVTSMSSRRSTTPTRPCQHMTDMRDVLRGVRSGMRPSTPIPGMPPVPPKQRPPPTSFRPVSSGGRERGRSGTPSSATEVREYSAEMAPLTRSQSHKTSSGEPARFRSRTRSLESLRGTAQALASASTAPIRNLFRARSFIRNSQGDDAANDAMHDEEDGVWVCVDIKPTGSGARDSAPTELEESSR